MPERISILIRRCLDCGVDVTAVMQPDPLAVFPYYRVLRSPHHSPKCEHWAPEPPKKKR